MQLAKQGFNLQRFQGTLALQIRVVEPQECGIHIIAISVSPCNCFRIAIGAACVALLSCRRYSLTGPDPSSILAYAMRMNHRLWREIEARGMGTREALAYFKQTSSITTRRSERGIGFPIRIRRPRALALWFLLRQSHLT